MGLTGLAGVLAPAAYDFVAFPDVEGCALSIGGSAWAVEAVEAVAMLILSPVSACMGGVGPCVGDGAPEWMVAVVRVVAGGVGLRCHVDVV